MKVVWFHQFLFDKSRVTQTATLMPYEKHEKFETPEELGTCIWRYMSFTKLLALLNDSALYFARADKLTEMDPFEGSYTLVNASVLHASWDMATPELWAERNIHSEDELMRYIEGKKNMFEIMASTMREMHFINCWHLSEGESDAMWKLYSGAQDGVCIRSTLGGLIDSFTDTEERVFIGKVQYLDYTKEAIDEGLAFAPFLSKRLSFRHEEELRAIIVRSKDTEPVYFHRDGSPATAENYQNFRLKNKYPDRHGLSVPIDVSKLVDEVYVSPTSGTWFNDLIQSMIEKLGYDIKVRKSNLADAPPQF